MTVLPFEQPALTGITPVVMSEDDESHIVEIGVGLAAAYLAYRWWVKPRLAQHKPRTPEESRTAASLVTRGARVVWERLARPAVMAAYTASTGGVVPYPVVEKMAQAYIDELGDYVDSTSVDALVEGFTAQISNGWGEGISWMRASEGFGLDGRQMRSYLSGLMGADKTYSGEPIPPQVIKKVNMAIMRRADLLGMNESRKAVQMGKNMLWLAMAAQGDLPPGTMKKWVTAEDERVCAVCGPLDQVTIPLHQQFESAGQRFYAPVVHPNCRCNLEIVYPPLDVVKKDAGDDKYDRNRKGQFWFREERAGNTEERFKIVAPQQEKFSIVAPQQVQFKIKAQAKPMIRGEARHAIAGETRHVLRPIESVVDEVQQIADEAVAAQGNPLRVFEEPAYIPAYMILRKQQPKWLNDYYGDLLGRHITLENGVGYTVPDLSNETDIYSVAFFNAIEDDVHPATLTVVGRNKEANRAAAHDMGGEAVSAGIAPGIKSAGREEDYEFVRESLGGMTHRQLLNAAESALRNPIADNPLLYLDPEASMLGTEDMLKWMKTIDATTLASEMFSAYHREQREIAIGRLAPAEASWTNVIEVIKDAAVNGDKKGIFDYGDMGKTVVEQSPLYMFRVNKWLGDKPPNNLYLPDTELVNVSGVYEITQVQQLTLPITVQSDLWEHGKHSPDVYEAIDSVILLDLDPVGLPKSEVTSEGR